MPGPFWIFQCCSPAFRGSSAHQGTLPFKTHYHSHVNDIAELHMKNAVVRPVFYLFDKLRWMQHGDIHLYIGYILLAIVLLQFLYENISS